MRAHAARWMSRLAGWVPLAVGGVPLAAMAGTVHAQAPDVQLAPSAAVTCLTPPAAQRGEPEYPFAPWKRGEGGRVLVELSFGGPDLAPAVQVLEQSGDESLVQAVKAHVSAFRVPCAEALALPVRLRQDYAFVPDKRKVLWTTPADQADAARRRVLKCMASKDGSKYPEYPDWARRAGVQGRVLAKLRFTGPDLPPEVTVHAASRDVQQLAKQSVKPWAEDMRLPCMEGFAVEGFISFLFRIEGDRPFGFRNTDFLSFLRMSKNLEQSGAVFDTQAMGCPFDVAIDYLQPYYPNRVGEVQAAQPSRRPLLEWLSTLVLNLNREQQDSVAGDTVRFTVPCIKIDLNPKEKSS